MCSSTAGAPLRAASSAASAASAGAPRAALVQQLRRDARRARRGRRSQHASDRRRSARPRAPARQTLRPRGRARRRPPAARTCSQASAQAPAASNMPEPGVACQRHATWSACCRTSLASGSQSRTSTDRRLAAVAAAHGTPRLFVRHRPCARGRATPFFYPTRDAVAPTQMPGKARQCLRLARQPLGQVQRLVGTVRAHIARTRVSACAWTPTVGAAFGFTDGTTIKSRWAGFRSAELDGLDGPARESAEARLGTLRGASRRSATMCCGTTRGSPFRSRRARASGDHDPAEVAADTALIQHLYANTCYRSLWDRDLKQVTG